MGSFLKGQFGLTLNNWPSWKTCSGQTL